MPTVTAKKPRRGAKSNSINMPNDPRFAKVRAVFEARGLAEVPLAIMVRIALDEWLNAQK